MRMDCLSLLLLLVPPFLCACISFLTKSVGDRKSSPVTLPPGPRPYPIVGNILELGNKPHEALANLSKTHGPIMTLKLGSITTIVISSPELAKEALQTHDQAFSGRTFPDCARALDHHKVSVGWLPVSAPWRNLRKFCAVKIFSRQRLDASQGIRQKKVQELLDYVQESCSGGYPIDIGQAIFTTVLNSISNNFFSTDLAQHHSDSSQRFSELVRRIMEEMGNPNVVDYFPVLRIFDPQRSRKRMTIYWEKMFRIFDDIINERLQARASSMNSEKCNDLLDSLLKLAEEYNSELSLNDIKHLLLDLFFAGIDTASITVEWAMAELLHNPEKHKKAQYELRELLGKDGKVEEFDISKFSYIQAIVKETLRLHPPGPFLLPHKAESQVELFGFMVPKNSQILVNVWAMGRDSKIWPNPNSFMPERFLDREIDYKGLDFEFIPFGSGRRICPGMPLAHRMVHLTLASLVYAFDWKLADGLKSEELNMSEKFGLTLHKAEPLLVIPIRV